MMMREEIMMTTQSYLFSCFYRLRDEKLLSYPPPSETRMLVAVQQQQLPLCPVDTAWEDSSNASGYLFRVPAELTDGICIEGLEVPNQNGVTGDAQFVQVLVFDDDPVRDVNLGDGLDRTVFYEAGTVPIGQVVVPPNGGIHFGPGQYVGIVGYADNLLYDFCPETSSGVGYDTTIGITSGPYPIHLDPFIVFGISLGLGTEYVAPVTYGEITPVAMHYAEGPCVPPSCGPRGCGK